MRTRRCAGWAGPASQFLSALPTGPALTISSPRVPTEPLPTMDIAIQHPWFKRTLGPFYPSRLFDQFFGEGLFEYDLLPFLSSTISPYYRQSLFRTVLDSGISEVRSDRDKFVIFLDVKHFSPEDLTVKVQEDFVEIHGKHNERQDDHGYISREFHRRYRLPSNVDQSALSCSLSADGMLTFSGPKCRSWGIWSPMRRQPVAVNKEQVPHESPSDIGDSAGPHELGLTVKGRRPSGAVPVLPAWAVHKQSELSPASPLGRDDPRLRPGRDPTGIQGPAPNCWLKKHMAEWQPPTNSLAQLKNCSMASGPRARQSEKTP
ncbi:hypothetical protein E5288_WYG010843 [Bos mutus]|uniref:Alpha-crystallin A chain n=2 Tax=Boreoeutheria TaxID=1437010 RepID=A0A6B0R344_9CETA|nr:hypothetical protein [Bos mutus]